MTITRGLLQPPHVEAEDRHVAALSFHEAGHAIAAWTQGVGVYHVSIVHQDEAGGQTALHQEPNVLHSVPSMERMAGSPWPARSCRGEPVGTGPRN